MTYFVLFLNHVMRHNIKGRFMFMVPKGHQNVYLKPLPLVTVIRLLALKRPIGKLDIVGGRLVTLKVAGILNVAQFFRHAFVFISIVISHIVS